MDKKEVYIIPIRIESEGNKHEHYMKKYRRKTQQRIAIRAVMMSTQIKLPCKVTLTRIAPRSLDDHDNLRSALKQATDVVADLLIPGLQPGRADSDERISWEYQQEKGYTKEYALRIELQQE